MSTPPEDQLRNLRDKFLDLLEKYFPDQEIRGMIMIDDFFDALAMPESVRRPTNEHEGAVRVLVMRRGELSDKEIQALRGVLGAQANHEIDFYYAAPTSGDEWLAACTSVDPDFVILPESWPLHKKAMEAGYCHVALLPEGPYRLVETFSGFERL